MTRIFIENPASNSSKYIRPRASGMGFPCIANTFNKKFHYITFKQL